MTKVILPHIFSSVYPCLNHSDLYAPCNKATIKVSTDQCYEV